ncbi:MAG: ABC transporter substrate-binding protein [Oscillospiraceae bacterium]|jgi:peptide/nickel transport system substrate-binding protein|nr:ABC transporter substrate-binding protein [Oscillospiraceae bacterium]
MKKLLAILSAIIALSLILSACSSAPPATDSSAPAEASAPEASGEEPAPAETTGSVPLVIAQSDMNGKFSPFTGETAYDMAVADMVLGQALISYDRVGELVYNGIEGETRAYNGSDYTYTGIADGTVARDEGTDTTVYHLKLREGVKFSDGEEVTADDVIFTYYVYADPAYQGNSTFYSIPVLGMADYRKGYQDAAQSFMPSDEELDASFTESVQAIVDFVNANYADYAADISDADLAGTPGFQVALGMYVWGFGEPAEDGTFVGSATKKVFDIANGEWPTIEDYKAEMAASYQGGYADIDPAEWEGTGAEGYDAYVAGYIKEQLAANPDAVKQVVPNISGITKINDYELEIVTEGFAANAVYQIFGIQPAPLHYYGDESQYDYENNKFGFEYGKLDFLSKTESEPMGAGPYKFVKFENKIVYFEANENYWKGAPATKEVQFKTTSDSDMIPGIETGTIDIAEPANSLERRAEIESKNSNGEVSGDVITYQAVNNLGYGYVGLNAKNVSIGGERGSEASKNLRKGLATVLAVYRDLTVNSYYGENATVINYPISLTSWAAPQPTDPGYEVAYSKDVKGNPIYTAEMTEEERYAAAEQAALGFFEAAGYTVENGKITAAPAGGELTFDAPIIADGTGDHPSFLLLTKAAESLANIGITMNVIDISQSNASSFWDDLSSENLDLWCAAWQSTLDPDIYQIYHSDGLIEGGTGSNNYGINDSDLDTAIVASRTNPDNNFRKEVFKEAFGIILDWGVELPVYQRQNCMIFSTERINTATLPGDMTTYYAYLMEIEKIEMN